MGYVNVWTAEVLESWESLTMYTIDGVGGNGKYGESECENLQIQFLSQNVKNIQQHENYVFANTLKIFALIYSERFSQLQKVHR